MSPSRVEEVVGEFLDHEGTYLRMAETKRAEGHWRADIQCPISTEGSKPDSEESQVLEGERCTGWAAVLEPLLSAVQ